MRRLRPRDLQQLATYTTQSPWTAEQTWVPAGVHQYYAVLPVATTTCALPQPWTVSIPKISCTVQSEWIFLCVCLTALLDCMFLQTGTCQPLCCSLSPFGIQYRPGYNNWRLISGPRTRVFAVGQEIFSVVPGAVLTVFWQPLASIILCSVHLWAALGEKPVCVAVVLSLCTTLPPTLYFSGLPLLPFPPPPHPATHSQCSATVLLAVAKNKSSLLHSNGFLYSASLFSSHKSPSGLNLR